MTASTHAIVILVFLVATTILAPPDTICQISAMIEMAVAYGVLLFIVSRFKSFAQTPQQMKTVIFALLCLLAIATKSTTTFFAAYRRASIRYGELLHERSERVDSAASVEGVE